MSMKRVLKRTCGALLVLSLLLLCAQALVTAAEAQEGIYTVILLRHGQSYMNVERRVSGWGDTRLTEAGRAAGFKVGELMKREGVTFDAIYTSYLARAIKTAWLALEGMDMMWIPVHTDWRLNETEHGAFEGRTREENVAAWGEDKVNNWEATFDMPPPPLVPGVPSPADDLRYSAFSNIPKAESMEDTLVRVRAYWEEVLIPAMRSGKTIVVVGHTNVLRVLSKCIDDTIDINTLRHMNIPNTVPIIYTLDSNMRPVSRRVVE